MDIEEIFYKVRHGTREDIRNAKKEMERLWHRNHKAIFKKREFILGEIRSFDKIQNVINQAGFVSLLKLPYLVLADEHWVELKNFILKIIQHSSGAVRQAAINIADWLRVSVLSSTHPIHPVSNNYKEKSKQGNVKAQYAEYFKEIETLIDHYDDGSLKPKYVDQMNPSVYKSLQILYFDAIRGAMHESVIPEGDDVVNMEFADASSETKSQLAGMPAEKQGIAELELVLKFMLDKYELNHAFNKQMFKEIIYNETGSMNAMNAAQAEFLAVFGAVEKGDLFTLINVFTDAWNYYPHRSLGGKSPYQKLKEL